eukprot:scaffold20169_cov95-Cylindrotheca_fusiformis.AAC.1
MGRSNFNLLKKNAAITGLAGAAITNLMYGPADILGAIFILLLGAVCHSVACYLFFLLSIKKTDTLLANCSSCPVLVVIVGVALYYYNQGRGDDLNPLNKGYDNNNNNMFDTVTTEPFGAAILGFLTYRLPLFVGQVVDAFKEDAAAAAANGDLSSLLEGGGGGVPTGSAGMVTRIGQKG